MELDDDIFKDDSNIEEPNVDELQEDFGDLSLEKKDNLDFENNSDEESILTDLLKSKGIIDNKINIIDEDGTEKEYNFNELSKEEKLQILLDNPQEENTDLGDDEIEFLNILRENDLSIDDFLEKYKERILSELSSQSSTYNIDSYNDNELFLLDLKNKFELSDEELQLELEKELLNEDLFKKKMSKIREGYKKMEDAENQRIEQDTINKRTEEYNKFKEEMIDFSSGVSEFHGIILDDSEKQETLSYLLDLDESGVSRFAKDLNKSDRLFEAAWFLRYGKEAFQAMEQAYEAEIARLKKDKPRVVVQNSKKNDINSIHQLN